MDREEVGGWEIVMEEGRDGVRGEEGWKRGTGIWVWHKNKKTKNSSL